jgi:molecular chaperone GrpE (heat shock protein)
MTDDTNTTPENGETPEGAAAAESSAEDIVTELLDTKRKLAYLAAEFDNYRKRTTRERESLVALLEGVRMTYGLFVAELRKFGVEQMTAAGQPFDPSIHEAIAQLPAPHVADGTVLDEACKGYTLNSRLLRAAQVTVARGGETPKPGGEGR